MSRFLDQIKKTKEAREKAAQDKAALEKASAQEKSVASPGAVDSARLIVPDGTSVASRPDLTENSLIPEFSKPEQRPIIVPSLPADDAPVAALIPEVTNVRKQTFEFSEDPTPHPEKFNAEIKDLMAEIFAQSGTDVASDAKTEEPMEGTTPAAEEALTVEAVVNKPQLIPDSPEPVFKEPVPALESSVESSAPVPEAVAEKKAHILQGDDTLPPFEVEQAPVESPKSVLPSADELYPAMDFEIPKSVFTTSNVLTEAVEPEVVEPVAVQPVVEKPALVVSPVPSAPVVVPPPVAVKPTVSVPATPASNMRAESLPVSAPALPATKVNPEPLPAEPLFPNHLESSSAATPVPVVNIPQTESPLFPNADKRDATPGGGRERHRLTPKRAKGEIPVPGPAPDPLAIQRITTVYPRPDKRVLSFYEPKHHICEEYRLLGKNLLHTFASTGEITSRGKVVTLTSSIRGEGKTLTSINLALNMADDLKNRILLIDGDLRHPKVHKYLGLPGQTGLNDLINSADPKSILEDCIVRTENGLHCLFSQATRENPAPILDTPRMSEILELLRDRYSVIIIDTPPVLLATDSLVLGSRSDGILFILRARKTKREQIQEARQRIARLEIRMLGYVINNVKTFLPKIWSRYYYGNY